MSDQVQTGGDAPEAVHSAEGHGHHQGKLIALAIGVTQKCSGCIGFHVQALHKLGATRAELDEMLGLCVYMGGGPALMYCAEAIDAWEKLTVKTA